MLINNFGIIVFIVNICRSGELMYIYKIFGTYICTNLVFKYIICGI